MTHSWLQCWGKSKLNAGFFIAILPPEHGFSIFQAFVVFICVQPYLYLGSLSNLTARFLKRRSVSQWHPYQKERTYILLPVCWNQCQAGHRKSLRGAATNDQNRGTHSVLWMAFEGKNPNKNTISSQPLEWVSLISPQPSAMLWP